MLINLMRINRVNEIISQFRQKSDLQQGYIELQLMNGISENSWGTIVYRFQSSGRADGEHSFKSFKELEEILEKLIIKDRKDIVL